MAHPYDRAPHAAQALSLRAMGQIYLNHEGTFPPQVAAEAAELVKDVRAAGWTWQAISEAARLDTRTLKRIGTYRDDWTWL